MPLRYAILILCCGLFLVSSACAQDLVVLPAGSEPLCFAVLGNTHYTPPDFRVAPHIRAIAERAPN